MTSLPLTRVRDPAGARARFGPALDRMLDGLVRADPVADEIVATARSADEALARLEALVPARPVWLDDGVLDRGGELVLRAGPLAMIVLASSSLPQGYASPAGNKPLVLSGRLEQQAYRRMHETARFLITVCTPGAMRPPDGEGIRTCLRVRLVHARVRQMIAASGAWDRGAWGEPANQHDTLGTLLMFTVVLVEGLRALGLRVTPAEAERYLQLFRWVGLLLGIDEPRLPTSYPRAEHLSEMFRATRLPPDDDSRALVRALYDSPLREAETSIDRAAARLFSALMIAGSRATIDPALRRALDVPRAPIAAAALRASRPLVWAWDLAARTPARARTIALGREGWERFIAHGLRGERWDFPLPERLVGRAPRAA